MTTCDKREHILGADWSLLQALIDEVSGALEEFETLQAEQRQDLQAGKIEGIALWREKRQRLFQVLQGHFAEIEKNASLLDQDFVGALLKRLQALLRGEAQLNEAVQEARESIRAQLSAIRKGKATLQGYRVMRGAGSKPRFLSSRT